jgi:hypothetical protein
MLFCGVEAFFVYHTCILVGNCNASSVVDCYDFTVVFTVRITVRVYVVDVTFQLFHRLFHVPTRLTRLVTRGYIYAILGSYVDV